jgi:hypothetical protein
LLCARAIRIGPAAVLALVGVLAFTTAPEASTAAVEVRTETSRTVDNPDGTRTTELYAGPVHVRRAGAWVPVDLTLRRDDDGKVRPVAHPRGLVLSGGGTGDLAGMEYADTGIVLPWTGVLPEPVLQGNRAVYPGTDLVVEAVRTGLRYSHVSEIPARTTGLAESTDGVLFDRAGLPSGRVTRISEDPSDDHQVQTTHTSDWSVTLGPVFDAYVQVGNDFTDTSGEQELRLGTYDGTTVARSFLNWDTSPLAPGRVERATVHFEATHSWSCQPNAWELWTTGLATAKTRWANQPTWDAKIVDSTVTRGYSAGCPKGPVEVDVTALARDWAGKGATAAGMGLRAADETDVFGWKKFASAQTDTPPRLEVVYSAKSGTGRPARPLAGHDVRTEHSHSAHGRPVRVAPFG